MLVSDEFISGARDNGTQFVSTYLDIVKVIEQWGLFHSKVMRDKRVEAIGQVQDVGVRQGI